MAAADEMRVRVAGLVSERTRVVESLRSAGWGLPDPQGNFVWLPVLSDAAALGVDLERQGVVTRAFPDVGVRVTVASAEWNDRFLAALATVRPRSL